MPYGVALAKHWILVLGCLGSDDFPVFEGKQAIGVRVAFPHGSLSTCLSKGSGVLNLELLVPGSNHLNKVGVSVLQGPVWSY